MVNTDSTLTERSRVQTLQEKVCLVGHVLRKPTQSLSNHDLLLGGSDRLTLGLIVSMSKS